MEKVGQGPEDSQHWAHMVERDRGMKIGQRCVGCEKEILLWHCPNAGCAWCAQCGADSKPPERG